MDFFAIFFQVVGWVCVSFCFLFGGFLGFGWLRNKIKPKKDEEVSFDHYFYTMPPRQPQFGADPERMEDHEPEEVVLARQALEDAGYGGIQRWWDSNGCVNWVVGVGPRGDWCAALYAPYRGWTPAVQWRLGQEMSSFEGGPIYRVMARLQDGVRFLVTAEPRIASEWPPQWEVHHAPGASLEELLALAKEKLGGRLLEDRAIVTFAKVYEAELTELNEWQALHGEASLNEIRRVAQELNAKPEPNFDTAQLEEMRGLYGDVLQGLFIRRFLAESGISALRWNEIKEEVFVAIPRHHRPHHVALYDDALLKAKTPHYGIEVLHQFEEPVPCLIIHDPNGHLFD